MNSIMDYFFRYSVYKFVLLFKYVGHSPVIFQINTLEFEYVGHSLVISHLNTLELCRLYLSLGFINYKFPGMSTTFTL